LRNKLKESEIATQLKDQMILEASDKIASYSHSTIQINKKILKFNFYLQKVVDENKRLHALLAEKNDFNDTSKLVISQKDAVGKFTRKAIRSIL
jgi:hypothetical protein